MIQNPIMMGGGDEFKVYNPTSITLSNSNHTATLNGVISMPHAVIYKAGTVVGYVILNSSGERASAKFNTMGSATAPSIPTCSYDSTTKTMTITTSTVNFSSYTGYFDIF